ncbi:N-6 DNA methylase [Tetragenococcus halophilus]|uniref:rRNA methyltransferase n=2 Tax=Tetragenococcus halophilus TaxID=51669 RepID=A0A2H6CMA7_TETHA|nr:N-6 DNA methylase [Tetragenococcus halophilus]AOF49544.1 hypothetical protein AC806_09230 [Tetragenococcus halophilus]MCF1676518.1 hypothetical protein [Tetragenococcus halophilus]MCO7026713.1 hypothetical protein [Tetragenococcus halophilus]MCO8283917.1 hypothetical protein [Tetragenococcus halophilus]MCO8285888.1 hypothetical protein [Tetragenococcus halophilus]
MKFKFEALKKDYSDFSSDKVLINAPRTPAFPVRVASEIMARCLSFLKNTDHLTIYDPCCGGAHLLTVLGFLYSTNLARIYGSDIDEKALTYARKNLDLLTGESLQQKIKALQADNKAQDEQTQSTEVLNSANRLATMLLDAKAPQKEVQCFQWDITKDSPTFSENVNIVITDLPYGNMTHWQGDSKEPPTKRLLDNIYQTLDVNNSVIAIICNKKERIAHNNFTQVNRLKHGKRQIFILQPLKSLK